MNVLFRYNNGVERRMGKRYADILKRMKRGTYLTADVRAAQSGPARIEKVIEGRDSVRDAADLEASGDVPTDANASTPVDLDAMGPDELRGLAKARGVKVHHKAGPEKIREALRGADYVAV